MQIIGQLPNHFTYNTLLNGLCKNHQLDEAIALFKAIDDGPLKPDIVGHNADNAKGVFTGIFQRGIQPSVHTYTIMIGGLRRGLLDDAIDMLQEMDKNKCSPNNCTYNTLIPALLKNKTSQALKLIDAMLNKGVSPNSSTVALLLDRSSINGYSGSILEKFCKFSSTS
ncbi:Pentatricopeptide repeat [Dillenia turbinata]|uniref:Pentatricopeptide repeat n=1 Tax=Dillenia turbinata TaxID=194707 RepID=A0AAN8UQ04_9MAGN